MASAIGAARSSAVRKSRSRSPGRMRHSLRNWVARPASSKAPRQIRTAEAAGTSKVALTVKDARQSASTPVVGMRNNPCSRSTSGGSSTFTMARPIRQAPSHTNASCAIVIRKVIGQEE